MLRAGRKRLRFNNFPSGHGYGSGTEAAFGSGVKNLIGMGLLNAHSFVTSFRGRGLGRGMGGKSFR